MDINSIALQIGDFVAEPLLIAGIAVGILLIFLGIRKTSKSKVSVITEKKKRTGEELTQTISILENMLYFNNKLLKELEIIELFNSETIKYAVNEASRIPEIEKNLSVINDRELVSSLLFFFSGQVNMLKELYEIENTNYILQKSYQQKRVFYNRAFEKSKMDELDEITLGQYKTSINTELENDVKKVNSDTMELSIKRKEFKKELLYSNNLINTLLNKTRAYKQKQVDNKKFYFKYMSRI